MRAARRRSQVDEDGSPNWIVASYIIAYTLVEIWVICQVSPGARLFVRGGKPPSLRDQHCLAIQHFSVVCFISEYGADIRLRVRT